MKIKEVISETVDINSLTARPEFRAIADAAPQYAKQLQLAWDGDIKEYKRSNGKSKDFLFPQMFSTKVVDKYAPNIVNSPKLPIYTKALLQLHNEVVSSYIPKYNDTSIWQHETKWAHESVNHNKYKKLCEDVKRLNRTV